MELYNIKHHKSSPYQPQTNGAIEAANKNVKNSLAKMVVKYKDWAKSFRLPYGVIEILSVHQLGQPPTLQYMGVKRYFLLRWRYNL